MTEPVVASQVDPAQGSTAPATPSALRHRNLWHCFCWVITISGYLFAGYAWLGPRGLDQNDAVYLTFWYAAFLARTFQFQAGIVLALVTAGCFMLRWKRTAAATLPAVLCTLGPSLPSYVPHSPQPTAGTTIRVMSANLLYLNSDHQPIIDEILSEAPDLLLLQEYTDSWHQAIHAAVSKDYPYSVWVTRPNAFGVAIYSKRPLSPDSSRELDCGSFSLPLLHAHVDFDGRRIAVYCIHMVPPTWKRLPMMRTQFHALLNLLAGEKDPMLLAGDFNFTGESTMHRTLRRLGLVDAHQAAGWGRGETWPEDGLWRFLPGVRIDHVYFSKGLTALQCRVGQGRHSDHRPVIVDLAFQVGA